MNDLANPVSPDRIWRAVALTLVVGVVGSLAAQLAGLPLPWLTGAMGACALAAICGAPMKIPFSWRPIVFVVLGISMGSGVTPESLELARTWPLSLLALALAVPMMVIVSVAAISRLPGWDRQTAMLAAMPGALSYVLAVAEQTGVDERRVAVVQSMRLVVLVLILPSLIVTAGGQQGVVIPPVPDAEWVDLGILAVACLAVGFACQRLRVPAGMLFGPMLVSAVAHGTGWTDARVPVYVLNAAMLVLGANIGARFTGLGWPFIRSAMWAGFLNLILATLVAAGFSAAVAWYLAIPFGQCMLAFAPGGAEAMAVLAFALHLDPAYVAIHHVARFLGLGICLPIVLRMGPNKPATQSRKA
ncbi:AbrB family transcriptional regulator [Tepidamorphus sp. 3E244]|uniref:AbrB family transcriptional regulator n=1 Tax=Tepidamorphus sp. 3E244 TaxID=3385498 RepID=UPI0038FCE87F